MAEEVTANEAYLDAMVAHQIYTLRYGTKVREDIYKLLDSTEKRVAEIIRSHLSSKGEGFVSKTQYNKLNRVKAAIKKSRSDAWDESEKILRLHLLDLVKAEPEFTDSIVKSVLPVVIETKLPAAETLHSIVSTRPFQGRLLKQWMRDTKAADLNAMMSVIQRGMVAGLGSDAIAKSVIGTSFAKGVDGVTQRARNNVNSIVTTAVQEIANGARREYFNNNADIVEQERFVATLDERTTLQCAGFDGKIFKFGVGPQPPLHMKCRSLRVVHFKGVELGNRPMKRSTQRQLLDEFTAKRKTPVVKARGNLPHGMRTEFDAFARRRVREMIGQVNFKITYQDFIVRQPAWFQNDVLGPTRAALLRTGKIKVENFTDRAGATITIPLLRQRYSQVFKLANL
jgi:SPP1 gp7 family putative phage head morphogenesis protein